MEQKYLALLFLCFLASATFGEEELENGQADDPNERKLLIVKTPDQKQPKMPMNPQAMYNNPYAMYNRPYPYPPYMGFPAGHQEFGPRIMHPAVNPYMQLPTAYAYRPPVRYGQTGRPRNGLSYGMGYEGEFMPSYRRHTDAEEA